MTDFGHIILLQGYFSFFAAGCCPKKINVCPENNGFDRLWGWGSCSPHTPGSYAYDRRLCMI